MAIDTGEAENLLNTGEKAVSAQISSVEGKIESGVKDTIQVGVENATKAISDGQVDLKKYFVVHRGVFMIAIVLFSIAFGLIMRTLYMGIDKQTAKIHEYEVKIQTRDSVIKQRNAQVADFDKSIKKLNSAINTSRDSVAIAYKRIDQLNKTYTIQNANHQKDNAAIRNLSLNDKISFVTGRKR